MKKMLHKTTTSPPRLQLIGSSFVCLSLFIFVYAQ